MPPKQPSIKDPLTNSYYAKIEAAMKDTHMSGTISNKKATAEILAKLRNIETDEEANNEENEDMRKALVKLSKQMNKRSSTRRPFFDAPVTDAEIDNYVNYFIDLELQGETPEIKFRNALRFAASGQTIPEPKVGVRRGGTGYKEVEEEKEQDDDEPDDVLFVPPAPTPAPPAPEPFSGGAGAGAKLTSDDPAYWGLPDDSRADRVVMESLVKPVEPPSMRVVIENAQPAVEPEVSVEHGLQAQTRNVDSVETVKEKYAHDETINAAYEDAIEAVTNNNETAFALEQTSEDVTAPGYLPDVRHGDAAQGQQVAQVIDDQSRALENAELQQRGISEQVVNAHAELAELDKVYQGLPPHLQEDYSEFLIEKHNSLIDNKIRLENVLQSTLQTVANNATQEEPVPNQISQARTQLAEELGTSPPPEYEMPVLRTNVREAMERATARAREMNMEMALDYGRAGAMMDGPYGDGPDGGGGPPPAGAPAPPVGSPDVIGDPDPLASDIQYDVTALDGTAAGLGQPQQQVQQQVQTITQIQKEIQALSTVYTSLIPAFQSPQIQQTMSLVMQSHDIAFVKGFRDLLMEMVKAHFQVGGMKVGVIVSPQSVGLGGGGGVIGGPMSGEPLPGMGGTVRINKHGNDVFQNVQTGQQGVMRGGRNYRSIINSRVPTNLPSLKARPSRLPHLRTFANTPMSGQIRIAKQTMSGVHLR